MNTRKRNSNDTRSSIMGADLVITVKEARKLLGKDFKELSDDQVKDMIVKLDLITKGFINQSISI